MKTETDVRSGTDISSKSSKNNKMTKQKMSAAKGYAFPPPSDDLLFDKDVNRQLL